MIGGGRGAFIGAVHRMAATLDGQAELVAGCFSSNAQKSKDSGSDLYLDSARVYSGIEEMAAAEAAMPEDRRLDFVSIVTPNAVHFPAAKAMLEAGFHVVCDKPMTLNLDEAFELRRIVGETGRIFALTHNYPGYPMIKQARKLVRDGELGKILKIVAEYTQDWLLSPIESEGQKQASWRTNPGQAGASLALGDIGTHAEQLARYISGLEIESLCADLGSVVPGRALDDDSNLLVHYRGGARGILYASQVSAGEENNLTIRIYGEKASLFWRHAEPNEVILRYPDQPARAFRRANPYNGDAVNAFTRIPPGHPEGFIEGFANVYTEVFRAVRDRLAGSQPSEPYDFPDVEDGVAGMAFLATAMKSASNDAKWTAMVPFAP